MDPMAKPRKAQDEARSISRLPAFHSSFYKVIHHFDVSALHVNCFNGLW